MTGDLESIHRLDPVVGSLPGEPVPYYLASGEGLRFERDGQLWTVIARGADTGGLFDAAYVLGPRGAHVPFHSLADHQRSYVVVDGAAQVWLPGRSDVLLPGDSVHVPEGTPFAYRMLGHLTRLLMYSAPSGALDALLDDEQVTRHVYSPHGEGEPFLPAGAQVHDLPEGAEATATGPGEGGERSLPEGVEPYALRRGEGDRFAWPDALNTYVARPSNTARRYFAVDTIAAPQPYIIRHFHSRHTENFLCLKGRIWLWANGRELLLTPGDFLHAPAGTIHSFAVGAQNTQMLGLLTGDVFEPFFEVTGEPTADRVYVEGLIDPMTIPARMRANPELDVTVVGPPPTRELAPGL